MISRSKKYVIILVVSSFAILFIILFGKLNKYREKMLIEGKQIVKTKNELISVSKTIQVIFSKNNMEDLTKQIGSFLHWLDSFPDERQLLVERNQALFDPNSGALIDAWGKPVKLEVKSEREYIFVSSGPNKKYDGGQGDDITYSFNPNEFKENKK